MSRQFTPEQQQAIQTTGANICVAAGAGSGKTGVLVERVLRIVRESKGDCLPPEERAGLDAILVVTFTEKATKEMKARLVAELNRHHLMEERQQVETAYISTVHGFCSRLLQENPFEAGVDPKFSVLDENQARRLLRQSFEAVVTEAYSRQDSAITELIARTQEEQGGSSALDNLAETCTRTLDKLRGAGRHCDEITRHYLTGCDSTARHSDSLVWKIVRPLIDEITACTEALRLLSEGMLGATRLTMDALNQHAHVMQDETATLLDVLASLADCHQKMQRSQPRHSRIAEEVQLQHWFHRVKTACEAAKELYGATVEREEDAARSNHALWKLLGQVWQRYDEAKRSLGQLDNDDLQVEAVRLLETCPGVRDRYRRLFRYLMVDEFQDTNPLQMRLLRQLHVTNKTIRLEANPTLPRNFLFVVGDVQQSIYAFRNADPTLFQELERAYRERNRGVHVPLAVNFRSRPEILAVLATIFQQLWRDQPTPFVPLSAGAPFDERGTPSVEILQSQDIPRRDYVRLEARAIAGRIQHMVQESQTPITSHLHERHGQPLGYRDITILLRSLNDVQKYEEALAQRGIPYYVVGGGRGYYARHEIRDLINILTVLETPLDDVALAAVLRSPFAGVTTDTLYRLTRPTDHPDEEENTLKKVIKRPLYYALEEATRDGRMPREEQEKIDALLPVLERLREQEDRLPVGHLLERLIEQTGYDARLLCRPGGRRRLANVRKLLQMANSDPVIGVSGFIQRLRDLDKLSPREGDAPTEEEAADVVRIMTIHGAKGLEFPVVFVADMGRGLLYKERGLWNCDPHTLALGTRLGGQGSSAYKAIALLQERLDTEEAARVLYVAMTRAREHLILCGNQGRNYGLNWADQVFPILGILSAPDQPETRTLVGGIQAQIAPLTYYADLPLTGEGSAATDRESNSIFDQVQALLK